MHEMGIASRIIEIATGYLPDHTDNNRVERINLRIGKLAAVVPESLRFCFEIISRNTPFSKAELNIEEVPVLARCNDCGEKWTVSLSSFICPKCNRGNVDIVSGRELDIVSIEIAE